MRIHEIIIEVGDVEEAIGFYTDVVGMRHVRTVEQGDARIAELDADGQRVSLVPAERPGIRLAVGSASVRGRERRLRKHEVAPDGGGHVEVDGGRWLGFADPWGNRLGFWEDDAGASQPDERT